MFCVPEPESETGVGVGGDLGCTAWWWESEWRERVYGVSFSSFSTPETVKDTDTVKQGKTQKLGGWFRVCFLLPSSPILPFQHCPWCI